MLAAELTHGGDAYPRHKRPAVTRLGFKASIGEAGRLTTPVSQFQ